MVVLEKHFASAMSHHSIGATANGRPGVYTTPAVSAGNYRARSFLSPSVSTQHSVEIQLFLVSHERMHTTQGRPSYRSAPVAGRQWGTTPHLRGRHPIGLSRNRQSQPDQSQQMSRPVHSLVSRLDISAVSVAVPEDKTTNMKTVDSTPKQFKPRFSGLAVEDWVDHVNELELQCARKHCWTTRQFFYALRYTISGAAMQTWLALERDEDQPDLGSLLPDWFECEANEYRDLLKKRTSFSRLCERTQLAIIYVYFFFRFQRNTPRSEIDNIFYCAQEPSENVEEWGYRLERLATEVLAYGQSISFDGVFVGAVMDIIVGACPFRSLLIR